MVVVAVVDVMVQVKLLGDLVVVEEPEVHQTQTP